MNPLLNAAQRQFLDDVQDAVSEHVAAVADEIDGSGAIPTELFAALGAAGVIAPAGDDGDEVLRMALAVEQVARKSGALASVIGSHAVATRLLGSGFNDHGALVAGTKTATLAAVETTEVTAVEVGGEFRLDGEARMVVAAGADWLLVPASQDGAEVLFVVAGGAAGVTVDEPAEMLGLVGNGTATVTFDGVTVAADARLGDATDGGDLLRIAQAALGVGLSRGALDAAVTDIQERKAAGERADRSQSVQWMLADIATEAEAARVTLWQAASQSPGSDRSQSAAMARLLAAEAAVGATRRAVQVFGERGALRSSGVERLYRDAKVLEIVGGTNEQQLARIAGALLPELTS